MEFHGQIVVGYEGDVVDARREQKFICSHGFKLRRSRNVHFAPYFSSLAPGPH